MGNKIFRNLVTAVWLIGAGLVGSGLIFARPAVAQDLSGEPGFIDFSQQATLTDDNLDIHLSVKDPLIKLVAAGTRETDPDLADVLEQLKAVEVHVYEVPEAQQDIVRKEITKWAGKLESGGWTEAITIRMKGARGHVFLRLMNDKPKGLAAMYTGDDGEAVFVNIVGQIDAAQVGRLATKFDLDVLGKALAGGMPNGS